MTISGRKIITLEDSERDILRSAVDLLNSLSDEVGNDDYYDFDDLADILYNICITEKFEKDFEQ